MANQEGGGLFSQTPTLPETNSFVLKNGAWDFTFLSVRSVFSLELGRDFIAINGSAIVRIRRQRLFGSCFLEIHPGL